MKGCLIEPIKHVGALSGAYCFLVTMPRPTATSEDRLPKYFVLAQKTSVPPRTSQG